MERLRFRSKIFLLKYMDWFIFFPFGCCDPVFLDPVVSYEMRSRFYVVASHDTSRIIDNIDILTIYLASEFFITSVYFRLSITCLKVISNFKNILIQIYYLHLLNHLQFPYNV